MILLDPADRNLALQYTPILHLDRREPFLPSRIGVTVFRRTSKSPSFPLTVTIPQGGADCTIEYAIWWDWDIWHLYEFEHLWLTVERGGRVVAVKGSRHGRLHRFSHWQMRDTHPVIYVQPGKHALASNPRRFSRWRTTLACTVAAGFMGLLVKRLFAEAISSSRLIDRAIRRHLRQFAFVPSFQFDREFHFPPEVLISWGELRDYIPERLRVVIDELLRAEVAARGG